MSEQPITQPVVPAHVAQPQDHLAPEAVPFTYHSPAGIITVPKFKKSLKSGLLRRIRNLDEQQQMYELLEAVCDEAALKVTDELDIEELQEFMLAWQQDSGVSLGESSGS